MPQSKIKDQHKGKYVAFGKQAGKLGDRDDIDELAIIAHESGDKSLIDLFEYAPSLEDLKKARTDAQLKGKAIGAPIQTQAKPDTAPTAPPPPPAQKA